MTQNEGKWCGKIAGTSTCVALSLWNSPLSSEKRRLASPHALEEANGSLHPAKAHRGAGSDTDWALHWKLVIKIFIIFLEIAP